MFEKHRRTKWALQAGADFVFELPVPYATGNAGIFAGAAVFLADSLGVCDYLSFGSESGKIGELLEVAAVLSQEPPDFRTCVTTEMAKGRSYAAARHIALSHLFSEERQEIWTQPNNTLALEYLTALLQRQSKIKPVTVRRRGMGYHQLASDEDGFFSASALREGLQSRTETVWQQMPEYVRRDVEAIWEKEAPVTADDFSLYTAYALLSPDTYEKSYYEVSADMLRRIKNGQSRFISFSDYVRYLHTKNLTYATASRSLLHVCLNLCQDAVPDRPGFLQLLGMRRTSAPFLGTLRQRAALPVIITHEDAVRVTQERPELLPLAAACRYADLLYCGAARVKYHSDVPFPAQMGVVTI